MAILGLYPFKVKENETFHLSNWEEVDYLRETRGWHGERSNSNYERIREEGKGINIRDIFPCSAVQREVIPVVLIEKSSKQRGALENKLFLVLARYFCRPHGDKFSLPSNY